MSSLLNHTPAEDLQGEYRSVAAANRAAIDSLYGKAAVDFALEFARDWQTWSEPVLTQNYGKYKKLSSYLREWAMDEVIKERIGDAKI